jgi:hypothetical protein
LREVQSLLYLGNDSTELIEQCLRQHQAKRRAVEMVTHLYSNEQEHQLEQSDTHSLPEFVLED